MTLPRLRFFLEPAVVAEGVQFSSPRPGDAGFDIRAAVAVDLHPGSQVLVATGLRVAIPPGWVGFIKDRSSVASKRIYTHGGVIDASYRGEVKILLSNHSEVIYSIHLGDKIAQMVVLPHLYEVEAVCDEAALGETDRASQGFGSTGR